MSRHANFKDFHNRKQFEHNQKKILILKTLLLKGEKVNKNKLEFMLKIQQLHCSFNKTKVKNRCMFSTKIRAVSRISNLTKSAFRENFRWGKLSGFRKASW